MKKELEAVNKDTFFYSDDFVDNPNEIYCDYHFTKDILKKVIAGRNNLQTTRSDFEFFKEVVILDSSIVAEDHVYKGNISTYRVQIRENGFPYLEITYTNRDNVEKSLYYEITLNG